MRLKQAFVNNKDWQILLPHCDLQLEILLLCLKVQSWAFAQLTVTCGHLQQCIAMMVLTVRTIVLHILWDGIRSEKSENILTSAEAGCKE